MYIAVYWIATTYYHGICNYCIKLTALHNYVTFLQGQDVDYNSGPYDVIIPAGHVISSFNISIIDDNIFERHEEFYLTIDQSSSLNGVIIGSPNRTVVKILENDGKCFWQLAIIVLCVLHTFVSLFTCFV